MRMGMLDRRHIAGLGDGQPGEFRRRVEVAAYGLQQFAVAHQFEGGQRHGLGAVDDRGVAPAAKRPSARTPDCG